MKRNDVFYILIPAFILIVIAIGFNIQHNAASSTISETTNADIAPIAPSFDEQTIQEIENREAITPIYNLSAQTGTQSATPKATTEANVTIASQTAKLSTESAQ